MPTFKRAAASGVVIALLLVTSLSAHHSVSAVYDLQIRVAVTGTLTKVDWINPHVMMSVEAKGAGGKVDQWTVQSNPPSWYRSVGLARVDFADALGKTVTVEGVRARDGSLSAYMQKITLPNGTSHELVSGTEAK